MTNKLFRTNIGRLERTRADLKNSFDHNRRIILSQENQGKIQLAQDYITKAIILLNQIQKQ